MLEYFIAITYVYPCFFKPMSLCNGELSFFSFIDRFNDKGVVCIFEGCVLVLEYFELLLSWKLTSLKVSIQLVYRLFLSCSFPIVVFLIYSIFLGSKAFSAFDSCTLKKITVEMLQKIAFYGYST